MSNVMNKVILVGHLGNDPEIRFTIHGRKVARFSLATNEFWNDQEQRHEHTEWHRIVAWRSLAQVAEDYLKKGSRIFMEGRLRTRTWYDQEGCKRLRTEILMDRMLMLDQPPSTLQALVEDDDEIQ